MKKHMYRLILMQNQKGEVYICYGVTNTPPHLNTWSDHYNEALRLESEGWKAKQMIFTSNRGLYLKALLKARLIELKAVCKEYNEYLQSLEEKGTYEEVLEEIRGACATYENNLCIGIGRLYQRVLRFVDEEYPIIDEVIPWCVMMYEKECAERKAEV